jgi:cytochrome c
MKKLTTILILLTIVLVSCGDKKAEEAPKKEKVKIEKKAEPSNNIAEGKKAFGAKGCTACHHETTKIIGPAVKVIASIYSEKNGDILKFLIGESDAIVDEDPTQVAIMKNNVDTMVKDISASDLANIVAYIQSVK